MHVSGEGADVHRRTATPQAQQQSAQLLTPPASIAGGIQGASRALLWPGGSSGWGLDHAASINLPSMLSKHQARCAASINPPSVP